MERLFKTMGIMSGRKSHGSRRLKALLILIIIALAGVMTALFVNYRFSMQDAEPPVRPEKTGAFLTISQFEHTALENGKKQWTLKADKARLFSSKQTTELSKIETVFFMENGEKVIMTADYGHMDMSSQNIRAWDNVIVRHPEYILKTESLNYKYDSRIMIIDSPLEITGNAIKFTADAGRYEMDEKTIVFEGNIESLLDQHFNL